jgi:predicted dehydrogenase
VEKIRTAVIGAGKMGSLHSRIYHSMDQVDLVAVVDKDPAKAEKLVNQYGGAAYQDYREIIDKVDAVTISAPTEFHARIAEPFLARSIPVLVEKPLAATLPEARHMLQLARDNNCPLQVGYSERFNPVVQAMARLHIEPRFMESQRISPYTFRSTDVGVVLDLMIHDIDIMLSLAHSPVIDVQAAGVNVLGQHEDIANVRIQFANGCVANLTASRLALKTERKIRIFSDQAYLSLDYFKKTGTMISKAANIDMVTWLKQQNFQDGKLDPTNLNWLELVNVEMLNIDDRESLELEQEAFIKAVRDGSRPQVSAEDAVAAMELAERIISVIRQQSFQAPTFTEGAKIQEIKSPAPTPTPRKEKI